MQTLKLFLISIVTLLFISCADKDKVLYTYELDSKTHDTINVTNEHGKQGRWVIENECAESVARPNRNIPYSSWAANTQTIGQIYLPMPIAKEIGNYVDDKKQGLWTYYDPYGDINKTQEFKDDLPVGI
jgi:hypothetical protein